MLKRIKVFDNEDDLYQQNQKKDKYEEDGKKEFDCTHLLESENEKSSSGSDSESSDER
jgi:hypothetical protein